MWNFLQEIADLVLSTKKPLMEKLHFLCSDSISFILTFILKVFVYLESILKWVNLKIFHNFYLLLAVATCQKTQPRQLSTKQLG